MNYLGIDPDLHHTAIAVVNDDGKVMLLKTIRIADDLTGRYALIELAQTLGDGIPPMLSPFVAAVEGQQLYKGCPASPQDIIHLACAAGICLAKISQPKQLFLPTPQEWKKQVPKEIHQARTLNNLGWGYKTLRDYSIPTRPPAEFQNIPEKEWKHLVDAIGLALWARDKEQAC